MHLHYSDLQGDIYNWMPESTSEKTFLGDATVRSMLNSLWSALTETQETLVVGLVLGLEELISKWDEECKKSVPLNQAVSMVSSDEGTHEYLTGDILNQVFGSMLNVSPPKLLLFCQIITHEQMPSLSPIFCYDLLH